MMHLLTEYKAELFLEREGFPIVSRKLCHSEKEATDFAKQHNFHVVLKVASDLLSHKSDINAVRMVMAKDDFFKAYKDLDKLKIEKEGILLQEYAHGKHLLLGLKKDPTFGHVLTVGIGGIYTELIKDVSFRIVPVAKRDVLEMVKELKAYKILEGFRGEKVNLKEIHRLLLKLSTLAEDFPNIEELDINPLVVDENEAKVVDARILFS